MYPTLRQLRQAAGLKQHELAERVGLSRPAISQLEHGHRSGSVHTLKKLAKALSVDLDVLVKGTAAKGA